MTASFGEGLIIGIMATIIVGVLSYRILGYFIDIEKRLNRIEEDFVTRNWKFESRITKLEAKKCLK